jgi:radical SAM superfamily enzyme YgiQ (UPF0313 family)
MTDVLLIQLPIPRLNYGRRTGNIPLAAACLQQAASDLPGVRVDVLAERVASFIGDAALLGLISERRPDIVGFTAYSWNIERILYLSQHLKNAFGPQIAVGGPEITPDNSLLPSAHLDFLVYGDGEAVFRRLLKDEALWSRGHAAAEAADLFRSSRSPYLSGGLEPQIENVMLLETQRGCPHHCAFCYYNKLHKGLVFAERDRVLEAVQWACDQRIGELVLLDPSLNARPDLPDLLKEIRRINHGRRLSIFSEARAEGIEAGLAALFASAGFRGFEIGLQTTHPPALKAMRRAMNVDRFLQGTRLLRSNGIGVALDLIIGLPKDTPVSFRRSVDFVAENDLGADVQLFPLAVLPGTEFRQRHSDLGLIFDPHPPYTIEQTPAFGQAEFLSALDYAENRLGTAFFPPPNLDIAWHFDGPDREKSAFDIHVRLGGGTYLNKLLLFEKRPLEQLSGLAGRLTLPYQIFIGPRLEDRVYLGSVLQMVTAANPFCPLEIVLIDPPPALAGMNLLDHIRLRRPHFLDGDLRFLLAQPGNRAVLMTVVSRETDPRFQDDMQRQIYRWPSDTLPEKADLDKLFELDGVLLDASAPSERLHRWQDRMAPRAADLPYISFSHLDLQKRWLALTAAEDYANGVMEYVVR